MATTRMSAGPRVPAMVLLLVLTTLIALGGCATRVKVTGSDPQLARSLRESPLISIGGVTVAPTVNGILSPDDARDAAHAVQRAFLSTRPEIEIWPLDAVRPRLGAAALARLVHEYGLLGHLRPDDLTPLADNLNGCRLLAMVRLTADEVHSKTMHTEAPAPLPGSSAHAETGGPVTPTVSTERKVTVTLEIFDVATGRSVWRAQAHARDHERYRYEDRLRSDPVGYVQQRLATSQSPVHLDRRGAYLKLPDLVELIEQAVSAAAQRLPAIVR